MHRIVQSIALSDVEFAQWWLETFLGRVEVANALNLNVCAQSTCICLLGFVT
jgi:hypothetical protein